MIEKGITIITKSLVEKFLSQRNITVIGVSHNPKKTGNPIFRSLKKSYNLFPINPNAEKIEGDSCYPDIISVDIGLRWNNFQVFLRLMFNFD